MREFKSLSEFGLARKVRLMNRAAQILLGISFVIGLNFLASKYFQRVDITEDAIYTLAAESEAYIRELKAPVEIIVTIPKDPDNQDLVQIHQHLGKLMIEYEASGRKNGEQFVRVEYVDIYRQRQRARELATQYALTQENIILVAQDDRRREIRQGELFEVENDQVVGFRGERAITSAIIEVTDSDPEKIYFLVGHGEMRLEDVNPLRGLSQLENFLRERGYQLATLDLAISKEVPLDADLVIIPSPQAGLLPQEVEKLRRYMTERNGRLITLIDPGRRHGLDDLFYDWGVLADEMVVVDQGPDFRAQGGDLIIRRFAEHPITDILVEYQITALFGPPRPVRTDPAILNNERVRVTQIVGTSEQSWAERDFRTQNPRVFDANRDFRGPVPIATVSSRSSASELGINIPGGRLVVFGNSDFIANNRLQAFGNRTLIFNAINWTLDRTRLLNIATRPLEDYQIVMSTQALNRLALYYAIIPLSAAFLGFLIYFIRRR